VRGGGIRARSGVVRAGGEGEKLDKIREVFVASSVGVEG